MTFEFLLGKLASLSNREKALLIWMAIFLLFILFNKSTYRSSQGILKVFFSSSIILLLLFFIYYVTGIILLLYLADFWDSSLLNGTIFWTFGFAVIAVFNLSEKKKNKDFQPILKNALKWMVLIEFLIAFYTFSLIIEIILIPILVLVFSMQAFAEIKDEYKALAKPTSKIIGGFGLILFGWIAYNLFFNSSSLLTVSNLKNFLLPVILTILFIPFIYVLSAIMAYEDIFVSMNFYIQERKLRRLMKWHIIRVAFLNLDKLYLIRKNLKKNRPYSLETSLSKIRTIAKMNIQDSQ